jgi:hypothetical protein
VALADSSGLVWFRKEIGGVLPGRNAGNLPRRCRLTRLEALFSETQNRYGERLIATDPAYPEVRRAVIDEVLIDDALRALHLDLLVRGASAQELGTWLWATHWFPHLNYDLRIMALAEALPERWRTGEVCDPQILLQFPHVGPAPEITFHVDREPDWAEGRRYLRIVGVALSPWRADYGALLVQSGGEIVPVELMPGDAVMMAPDLYHSSGINLTGAIRYGVYFRWLESVAERDSRMADASSSSR